MNRRTFLKFLSVLPFLGFLKPAKKEIPDEMFLTGNPGRTIFISNSGSDSNDGSSMKPVRTISRATELITTNNGNGSRIYIMS